MMGTKSAALLQDSNPMARTIYPLFGILVPSSNEPVVAQPWPETSPVAWFTASQTCRVTK
jgi:hypothetical protein